jgi:hypothetical protein
VDEGRAPHRFELLLGLLLALPVRVRLALGVNELQPPLRAHGRAHGGERHDDESSLCVARINLVRGLFRGLLASRLLLRVRTRAREADEQRAVCALAHASRANLSQLHRHLHALLLRALNLILQLLHHGLHLRLALCGALQLDGGVRH